MHRKVTQPSAAQTEKQKETQKELKLKLKEMQK